MKTHQFVVNVVQSFRNIVIVIYKLSCFGFAFLLTWVESLGEVKRLEKGDTRG